MNNLYLGYTQVRPVNSEKHRNALYTQDSNLTNPNPNPNPNL